MGYKAKANFSAGKGLDFNVGDLYNGPSELVENLIKEGLLVQDSSVETIQVPAPEMFEAEESDFELEDKPKKPSKKKGK